MSTAPCATSAVVVSVERLMVITWNMGVLRRAEGWSMLEHEHGVVAEAEAEVAGVEIAVVHAPVEIEELGFVGCDGLAVGGSGDDDGAVAFALLRAVHIPGVVAADRGCELH